MGARRDVDVSWGSVVDLPSLRDQLEGDEAVVPWYAAQITGAVCAFGHRVVALVQNAESKHDQQDADEERRRYRELLEELRTMIPGAQVLLAFLLTVPFAARFGQVDETGKTVFVVSLTCAAAATVLFLAPAAYHRFADRSDRRGRLRFGVRTAVIGLMLLGLAVAGVTFVVVRFLFGGVLAGTLAGALAVLAFGLWVVVPIADRHRSDGSSEFARR